MTMRRMTIGLACVITGLLGCGSGSGAQYYRVTYGEASLPMGSDCPGASQSINNYANVATAGTWTIYPSANDLFLLDGASHVPVPIPAGEHFGLLEGKRSGSGYSFTGTASEVDMLAATGDATITSTMTITVSESGPGLTGTLSAETKCTSTSGQGCKSLSYDGKDTDCTVQVPITGTQLTDVTTLSNADATTPDTLLGIGNSSVTPPPGSCNTDTDCVTSPSGPKCIGGFCVQCAANADCQDGLPVCSPSGACVQCVSDTDCTTPGTSCQHNFCQ